MTNRGRILHFLVLFAGALLSACASSQPLQSESAELTTTQDTQQALDKSELTNRERLDDLWRARSSDIGDFAVGPGDELQISALGVSELDNRVVRVSGSGKITLPLLGTLEVSGMTENQISELLEKQLGRYMYNPQVEVASKSDVNRLVSVVGAVRNAGVYRLNGPHDTVRDLIERAGGLLSSATQEIELSQGDSKRKIVLARPLEPASSGIAKTSVAIEPGSEPAVVPLQTVSAEARTDGESGLGPLVITVKGADSGKYMDLPVRPGDSLYVPEAGNVTVVGWVYRPSVVAITKHMSVLEAVSACGGPLFAADMSNVKLIRRSSGGPAEILKIDLKDVESEKSSGLAVQGNDVIEVPYSALRIPGYAVYYAMQGMVSFLPAAAVTSGGF